MQAPRPHNYITVIYVMSMQQLPYDIVVVVFNSWYIIMTVSYVDLTK